MSHNLPPHLTWPLKVSQVEQSLAALADDVQVARSTWRVEESDTPLSIEWHSTRREFQGSPAGEGPTLRLRPVHKEDRARVSAALRRVALPDLVRWLDHAYTAPETWQTMRHERSWRVQGDLVEVADVDGLVHVLDSERGGHRRRRTWIPLTETQGR